MVKKISFVGAIGALLLVSLLAAAQKAAPPSQAALVLGALEGTINFCSKAAPESAEKYEALGKFLTNGQSEEAIAQIRNSKEYKDSLDNVNKQLGALSSKEAAATCKGNKK